MGFASIGLVYLTVGALALKAAFGRGGETTDAKGAIERLASGPLGEFLLLVLALGLLGYSAWRFAVAFSNPEGKDTAHRLGYLASGVIHTSLAIYAFRLWQGVNQPRSMSQDWSARLLRLDFGPVLLGAAGLALIGVGVAQCFKAYRATFRHELHLEKMERHEDRNITRLGRWGYSARGVVFGLTGMFVLQAALASDASQVRGLEGALDTLAAQPYGPWLLALVAAGLVAYGIFMLAAAKYKKVHAR